MPEILVAGTGWPEAGHASWGLGVGVGRGGCTGEGAGVGCGCGVGGGLNWRGRDGNDPSVDIAKDADQRF